MIRWKNWVILAWMGAFALLAQPVDALETLTVTLSPNGIINGGLGTTQEVPMASWILKAPGGYLVHSSSISPDEGIWKSIDIREDAASHIYEVNLGTHGVNRSVGATVLGSLRPPKTAGGGQGTQSELPAFTANAIHVDLDADTDNDGVLTYIPTEDEAEDTPPGLEVILGSIQPVVLKVSRVSGTIQWTASEHLTLYADDAGTDTKLPTHISPGQPVTVYVKGKTASLASGGDWIKAECTPDHGNGTKGFDTIKVTVVTAFAIQITAFIPEDHLLVWNPWEPLSLGSLYGGDGDGAAPDIFNRHRTSFRLRQKVIVIPSKILSESGLKDNSKEISVGHTRQYDPDSSLGGTPPKLTDDAKADMNAGDGDKMIAEGVSDPKIKTITVTRETDTQVKAYFRMSANNPLVTGSPAIDWEVTIKIDVSNPVVPHFSVVGSHDQYPAYDIYIDDQKVHQYDPRATDTGLSGLIWSMDFSDSGTLP